MKKNNKQKQSGTGLKKTLVNPVPKVVIVVGLLLLLLGASLYYQFANVGQATKPVPKGAVIETKVLEDIKLDELGAVHFNPALGLLTVKEPLLVDPKNPKLEDVTIETTKVPSGLLQYKVYVGQSKDPITKGYLNDKVQSSGDLYLDGDLIPDMELVYVDGVVQVLNLNFVTPELAKVMMFDKDPTVDEDTKVDGVQNTAKKLEVLNFADKDKKVEYYFKVESTMIPTVTAQWKGGVALSATEFADVTADKTQKGKNPKYSLMKLSFTPKDEKPYVLQVTAKVGDITVVKEYTFAVGGYIYDLVQTGFPEVIITPKDATNKDVDVEFIFKSSTGLYAFSLPCGSKAFKDITDFNKFVDVVYEYDEKVQQWKSGAPANLVESFAEKKAYALRLKTDEELSFMTSCSLAELKGEKDGKVDANILLPDIKAGWNFVGIKGYQTLGVESLKVQGGKKISEVYVLTPSGSVKLALPAMLEPGKAYWVKVE